MIRYPWLLLASPPGERSRPGSTGLTRGPPAARTCVDPVVGLQLVLEAELLAAAVALIGLLAGVDALVALQRALVPEAAAAELALVRVVACKHTRGSAAPPQPPGQARASSPGQTCPQRPLPPPWGVKQPSAAQPGPCVERG